MTRRFVIQPDGFYISRPGHDALDNSVVRLVEPDYRMLEQHDQQTAYSTFVDGAPGWSRHRATIRFAPLPYKPMVHFGMAYVGGGAASDIIHYPEHLASGTAAGELVPDGKYKIGQDFFWCQSLLNSYTRKAHIFRVIVTVYKADSGLAL